MIVLLLGLALWIAAHMFKRLAPGLRARMDERMGNAAKGIFAALLVGSVVLMVVGYRDAPYAQVYLPPQWGVHVVDLLMLPAIALFGLNSSKSTFRGKLHHPQLLGFTLWAALHLLVNGDLASVVLWGVLIAWALAEMALISARDPAPEPYAGGSHKGTLRLAVITVVLYAVITAVHAWLGVWPFPR